MTREQAKEILNGMSFEECIDMWNGYAAQMYQRSAEIHSMDEHHWWDYLSRELGTYYLMWYLLDSSMDNFDRRDEYFFYDENTCDFYSFDDKNGLMKHTEEWFIEELINREN